MKKVFYTRWFSHDKKDKFNDPSGIVILCYPESEKLKKEKKLNHNIQYLKVTVEVPK